jgi:hypothetical protein
MIPNSASRNFFTRRGQNIISRVCDLIDPVTNQWDVDHINQTFWHVDVQRIISIHQTSFEMDDIRRARRR